MKKEIIATSDGSHTISIPELSITYHSKYGSIQESKHIFINAGLAFYENLYHKKSISIFEMGFGTGLNALLSWQYALQQKTSIHYTSIELHPISANEIEQLNYGKLLNTEKEFLQIHTAKWNHVETMHPLFSLHKIHNSLIHFSTSNLFDIIFYDAFAPTAQPELWTTEIFNTLYSLLKPNGVLVTYCSKSYVRKNMEAVGFIIQKIKGPIGKREMIRAIKK
ncbi:MAG: tRNA (5-methylaminomethyl-2-thiouridine)(34)-methyltransferase MnmD [Chitinophagaceae bacterium]|nr:tRNA (5-methylaminomethyl-2-thiouridine)(34)-methyltransferase MnmD [Chitinophagaceae bacterium]MCW5903974.1 tRNA (5-methylaminomethyl-2-thiouridine)(34)-methyltransferase MnmD [Chitinophagaceae bacterium]